MPQNVYKELHVTFKEIEVQKQMEEKKRLEKDVGKFVQAVVDNLVARFPSSEIIQAVKIFDPKTVPSSDADCAAYGESDLQLLTTQYSSFVDHNQCSLEWDTLKHCMKIGILSESSF